MAEGSVAVEHGGETMLLGSLLLVLIVVWLLFWLVARQQPQGAEAWERGWIEAFRDANDPEQMIGPAIVEETFRDLSALGGYAVSAMIVAGFAGYVGLRCGHSSVRFFLLTVLMGYGCGMLLKLAFGRGRPAAVPHLSFVATTSFPSVHSMISLILYMTIGLWLRQRVADRRVGRLFVCMPLLLTGFVGLSRIALGVHYPTDVLAGWTAGLVWLLVMFRMQPIIGDR